MTSSMRRPWEVSRRACLRGAAGTMIGLPLLDAMIPGVKRARAAGAPRRLMFFLFNGGTPETTKLTDEGRHGCLRPATTGRDYQLTTLVQPLADLKDDFMIISDLHSSIGRVGTGKYAGGDHPRQEMALLTGVSPEYADGPNTRVAISVDQYAANVLKAETPALPSLYLASGNRTVDGFNPMSWAGPTSPLTPIVNPSEAFRQVFGDTGADSATLKKRLAYRQSILHYANDETQRLYKKLGTADQQRLDQYLTSVRSIEERIAAASKNTDSTCGASTVVPQDGGPVGERIKQHLDMIVLAFQCDRTRVATFQLLAHYLRMDWLGQPYSDYPSWHDDIEHGAGFAQFGFSDGETRMDTYVKGATWLIEQFGYFVRKLKNTTEADGGSLLDTTAAVCTSEFAYGNGHAPEHLPVIVAGKGGGAITPGRHLVVPEQPIANLWVAMLKTVGINVTSFGNSTGALSLS